MNFWQFLDRNSDGIGILLFVAMVMIGAGLIRFAEIILKLKGCQ